MRPRRFKHLSILLVGIFIMVFSFTFLSRNFKPSESPASAANLANFKPGNIISNYVMENYNSMAEAEIQTFLKSKNSCNDTRTYLAGYYPKVSYHIKDGHFVCLADELFGEGINYGGTTGETAAHIIWQAAQDYKINPQVIIVLIQKEQGLITDTWPNNIQYRSATGYGCPDTAACNEKYYGFKNQVRNAASLFRTVLNGGWTNYPLGNNYIQYNPDPSCGGSVVNIENLATSALYRYTPYQPNAGALAAGYGTAPCGAYGNRNFYSYFSDWFGSSTGLGWRELETPRHLTTIENTDIINGENNQVVKVLSKDTTIFYTSKILGPDGNWCLRSESDEKNNLSFCVSFSNLKDTEWIWQDMETPRYLVNKIPKLINPSTKETYNSISLPKILFYNKKINLGDGAICIKSTDQSLEGCTPFNNTAEVEWEVFNMQYPRDLSSNNLKMNFINPTTNADISTSNQTEQTTHYFTKKIILPNGEQCLGDDNVAQQCVLYSNLKETWLDMEYPRKLSVNENITKIDAHTLNNDSLKIQKGTSRIFISKILLSDNTWCLRTEYDEKLQTNNCIRFKNLDEEWNYFKNPEQRTVKENAYKINAKTLKQDFTIKLVPGMNRKYISKILLPNNTWCLRTEYDETLNTDNCVIESNLY